MHEHTWIRMQVWRAHMCPLFDAVCACGRLQFSNFVARLSCAADRRWSLISDLDKFFQSISFLPTKKRQHFFFCEHVCVVVLPACMLICLSVIFCLWSRTCTAWCIEIGSLTSLNACSSGAFSDIREPFSLHHSVQSIFPWG